MSQLNRILAQDALERNLLLQNSRISQATWSSISTLPQKIFSLADEELIKENNEQFPSEEMNPEKDLELDAIPIENPIIASQFDQLDQKEMDRANDIEEIKNLVRDFFLERKAVREAYNTRLITQQEYIKKNKEINLKLKQLDGEKKDIENELKMIADERNDANQQRKEYEADVSSIKAKNKEQIEMYRQEKNLLNKGENSIPQQPNETEDKYIDRLRTNAERIAPEDVLFNSKIMIQRTFREKLKELVRSDIKIDQIANRIDPIDEVKNKHDIIKYWTKFKSSFLQTFGTKPQQLTADDVVEYIESFLNGGDDLTTGLPIVQNAAAMGKAGTRVVITADKDVAELFNPDNNKSVYFRIISPVAPQVKQAKLVLLYSFQVGAPKGSCEQYMETYLAQGQEKAGKIIRDETGISSADLKALGLSDNPDVIAKNLFKAPFNISITNDFTSGFYETANKRQRKEVFGYGVGGSVLPRYADFGKLLILLRKLYLENILSIRWKSKTNVAGFTHVKVSEDFVQIILNMMQGNSPTRMDIGNLTTQERHLYDRLISIAMLQKEMVHTTPKTVNDLKKRLKLIEGEIEAGNNNPNLVKEIKQVLLSLQHLGVITKSQINSYLKQF